MSQEPSQPAASPPEFVIPEWFQEEDAADLPAGEPVALPDIFDDLSAVRESGESLVNPPVPGVTANQGLTDIPGATFSPGGAGAATITPKAIAIPGVNAAPGTTATPGTPATPGTIVAPGATPLPTGEAPCRADPAKAQRLFEIASALGFMAGSLRAWDHEGAEGAAHLLASLAAELAAVAATGDHP